MAGTVLSQTVPPLATAAAVLFAVNVTAAVPLTPSNIGVFQAACVAVLATSGVIATGVAVGVPAAALEFSGAWASGRGANARR